MVKVGWVYKSPVLLTLQKRMSWPPQVNRLFDCNESSYSELNSKEKLVTRRKKSTVLPLINTSSSLTGSGREYDEGYPLNLVLNSKTYSHRVPVYYPLLLEYCNVMCGGISFNLKWILLLGWVTPEICFTPSWLCKSIDKFVKRQPLIKDVLGLIMGLKLWH